MVAKQPLSDEAAATLHNHLIVQLMPLVVERPIESGGTVWDVMLLCESLLVGIALKFFPEGGDKQMLEALTTRVVERLGKARLDAAEIQGHG
jgi:hypothetical protein